VSNREKKRLENKKRYKMYILVRDSIPVGYTVCRQRTATAAGGERSEGLPCG